MTSIGVILIVIAAAIWLAGLCIMAAINDLRSAVNNLARVIWDVHLDNKGKL